MAQIEYLIVGLKFAGYLPETNLELSLMKRPVDVLRYLFLATVMCVPSL